jgi:uncharacterized phage infection (PIP) family protein YhgE
MHETTLRDILRESEEADRRRGTGLWLRTWVALGAFVVSVVIAYLIFISGSLAGINGNLQVARDAVTDVNGNTKTLPGQIEAVNQNLTAINKQLKPIPEQAVSIRASLESISENGRILNTSLSDTNGKLVTVAGNLRAGVPELNRVSSQLENTSLLLRSILTSTGAIDDNLVDLIGAGPSGVATVNRNVSAINNALGPTRRDLGDILAGLGTINAHLTDVCKSPPINLLHGRQPC